MKERFKQLPEPLQQQVIRRFAVATVFVLLFFITLFDFWDVYLFLPCLFFAGFFIVNALRLFYTCVQVETTAIRRRIKSLTLEYEEEKPRLLTVSIRERMKRLSVGDTVTIYLSEKTPVYSRDGSYLIYGYYAVEIRKGA